GDSWQDADGSHGADTVNADGSVSRVSADADGKVSYTVTDEQGHVTVSHPMADSSSAPALAQEAAFAARLSHYMTDFAIHSDTQSVPVQATFSDDSVIATNSSVLASVTSATHTVKTTQLQTTTSSERLFD